MIAFHCTILGHSSLCHGPRSKSIMFKQINNYLHSLKSEFLAGIFAYKEINISVLTWICLIYGLIWTVDPYTLYFCSELTIFIHVIHSTSSKRSLFSWFVRFIWCRTMTWIFFYTIYSNLEDDQWLFYLTYTGLILASPLLFSWYMFDPYLITTKKSSDERFDFFVSRYPFYTGYGLIPTLLIFIYALTIYHTFNSRILAITIHCIIVLMAGKKRDTAPIYLQYIPYTVVQYAYSPADAIDTIINSI